MLKSIVISTAMIVVLISSALSFALEAAPRISDREIVERLTRLE